MNRKSTSLIALAAIAGLGAAAHAADPSYDDLQKQLQQLQARLDQLEARPVEQKPATQPTISTSDQVLTDAQRQSQLFAADGALTAGYDKGFYIKSEDGNFLLKPGILFQFRNETSIRTGASGDTENGFEFRRLRPRFDGNVLTPDLTYSVVLDTNRSGGGLSLLDAWAQYRFAPQWAVKAGQFRESWYHEGDVPDYYQLAVERSLIDATLGGSQVDRVQGISLTYGGTKNDAMRVELTYHDGANSKNTDFRDIQPGATPADPPVYIANFGGGARVEYKALGDWADYRDFSAKGDKQNLLVFGAGIDGTEAGDTNTFRSTTDVQWENTHGLGAYAAFNGNFTDVGTVAGPDNRFDWGALVQAGYLLNPAWEVFGRYEYIELDSDSVATHNVFNEITLGVNYFLGENGSAFHRAKITLDFVYLPNGAPSNQTGTGVLVSPNGADEYAIRAQFQLMI